METAAAVAAGGEPVAPTDDESGVIAESAARKIILAAATGNGGTEFGHGGCAGERVETAEEPDTEKHPGVREKLGNVAGRVKDAGADGVADRRGHAKPHAKTWSRRPRPTACVELTVEEVSDDSDNVRSRGMPETQPSYRGEAKMQAGSGEEF